MDNMELNVNEMEKVAGGTVPAGGVKERPNPKAGYEIVQIGPKDTLWGLAKKYNTTIEAIMKAKPSIKDRNLIRTGYYLYIPTGRK